MALRRGCRLVLALMELLAPGRLHWPAGELSRPAPAVIAVNIVRDSFA
jgi:hypothetical protein